MSSQFRIIYFFLFLALFVSSCLPTKPPQVASPVALATANGSEIRPDGKDTIPAACIVEGYQSYITLKGNYCFAYPAGYYLENAKDPQHVRFMRIMDLASLDMSELTIRYAEASEEQTLLDLVSKNLLELQEKELLHETNRIPWILGGENAEIITVKQLGEEIKVFHIIYVKHGQRCYEIRFTETKNMMPNTETTKELDDLLFSALGTFRFIDAP